MWWQGGDEEFILRNIVLLLMVGASLAVLGAAYLRRYPIRIRPIGRRMEDLTAYEKRQRILGLWKSQGPWCCQFAVLATTVSLPTSQDVWLISAFSCQQIRMQKTVIYFRKNMSRPWINPIKTHSTAPRVDDAREPCYDGNSCSSDAGPYVPVSSLNRGNSSCPHIPKRSPSLPMGSRNLKRSSSA